MICKMISVPYLPLAPLPNKALMYTLRLARTIAIVRLHSVLENLRTPSAILKLDQMLTIWIFRVQHAIILQRAVPTWWSCHLSFKSRPQWFPLSPSRLQRVELTYSIQTRLSRRLKMLTHNFMPRSWLGALATLSWRKISLKNLHSRNQIRGEFKLLVLVVAIDQADYLRPQFETVTLDFQRRSVWILSP